MEENTCPTNLITFVQKKESKGNSLQHIYLNDMVYLRGKTNH